MAEIDQRYETYRQKLHEYDQSHLLAFWDRLNDAQREQLLDDLDQVDFARCRPLIDTHVRQKPDVHIPEHIDPPPLMPMRPGPAQADLYARARRLGEDAIRAGRVAAFVVAGGQGTRLGYDGPKGAFEISPVRNAPLFQLFAENLLGVERRYGHRPRWYIMTSIANHEQTVAFFEQKRYFGLAPDDVMFFRQGLMPAFLPDGKIALSEPHRVALSPDGHGGSFRALAERGALDDMRERGIDTLSYYQVDNPLVHTIDPLFIGLHIETGSEMSSKAIPKAHDTERVGNFCLVDGKVTVIEYSDLPEELAKARNADGSRRFDAGSIAIHVISREFIERLTAEGAAVQLPWHRADKKVKTVDAEGAPIEPDQPNAVKLEMFVFDAIPLAENPLVLQTDRAEEFSPVKNAEGTDSPQTCRRDMIRRAARWLDECGCSVPRDKDDEPGATIEISPKFAVNARDLGEQLETKPEIKAGESLLLE